MEVTICYQKTFIFSPRKAENYNIASYPFSFQKKPTNDNLEAMAKQLYDYWFVQFDFPNEEGKPYKSNGGAMVCNEKLKREIPQEWNIENRQMYYFLLGGTPPCSVPLSDFAASCCKFSTCCWYKQYKPYVMYNSFTRINKT